MYFWNAYGISVGVEAKCVQYSPPRGGCGQTYTLPHSSQFTVPSRLIYYIIFVSFIYPLLAFLTSAVEEHSKSRSISLTITSANAAR